MRTGACPRAGSTARYVRKDFPGSYTLLLAVPKTFRARIGALGNVTFPAGCYAYTGSALSGTLARIARHLRRRSRPHWHIDHLLQHEKVEILGLVMAPSAARRECRVSQLLLARTGSKIVTPGFGSSDCRSGCRSHLVYLGRHRCHRRRG